MTISLASGLLSILRWVMRMNNTEAAAESSVRDPESHTGPEGLQCGPRAFYFTQKM